MCLSLVHFFTSGRAVAYDFKFFFSVIPDVTLPESAASASSSEPQPSTSRQSSPPPPPQPLPTLSPILNANWAHEFVIPWAKMSRRNLMSYLERNVRPPPSARREMVRLIVDSLPGSHGKKTLAVIAQRIVAKYRASFIDEIDGKSIGTGYDSLMKQLMSRAENVARKNPDQRRKRQRDGDNEPAARKVLKLRDSYGCINYSPTDLPEGETTDFQSEHKEAMQASFARWLPNDQIPNLIKKTYYSQRLDIISKTIPILDLQTEWPYLFEAEGILPHFEELTGIKLREKLEATLAGKGARVLQWMRSQHQHKELRLITHELEAATNDLGNNTAEMPAVLLAIMAFFAEKVDTIVFLTEVMSKVNYYFDWNDVFYSTYHV